MKRWKRLLHYALILCTKKPWKVRQKCINFIEQMFSPNFCLYINRHSWRQYSCTYLKDKYKDEKKRHVDNAVHSHVSATETYYEEHYGNHPNPELGQQALNKVTQPIHGLAWLFSSLCVWKSCNNSLSGADSYNKAFCYYDFQYMTSHIPTHTLFPRPGM
jgi:hypothetical protein